MNAPPLIRSVRSVLQGRTTRCAWQQMVRMQQQRTNSSLSTDSGKNETLAAADAAAMATASKGAAPLSAAAASSVSSPAENKPPHPSEDPRLPRAVQALYLRPLRRECEYGVPSADLQLRAYNKRSLEFFADFALRAAYYLGLPAYGPVPLPRITERWTVPKSHFIFKKTQENFERITNRRLIQIRDGHPETVQIWLAFLRKHAYPSVGMKANVWEYNSLDVGKELDKAAESLKTSMEPQWNQLAESTVKQALAKEKAGDKLPDNERIAQIKDLLVEERLKSSPGGR